MCFSRVLCLSPPAYISCSMQHVCSCPHDQMPASCHPLFSVTDVVCTQYGRLVCLSEWTNTLSVPQVTLGCGASQEAKRGRRLLLSGVWTSAAWLHETSVCRGKMHKSSFVWEIWLVSSESETMGASSASFRKWRCSVRAGCSSFTPRLENLHYESVCVCSSCFISTGKHRCVSFFLFCWSPPASRVPPLSSPPLHRTIYFTWHMESSLLWWGNKMLSPLSLP